MWMKFACRFSLCGGGGRKYTRGSVFIVVKVILVEL